MSDSVSILSSSSVTQDSRAKYDCALGISGPARILVMFKRHTPLMYEITKYVCLYKIIES